MANFENLFVLKERFLLDDYRFSEYVHNNYAKRFTQSDLYTKIKMDSIEHFGKYIGIYEEAKLIYNLSKVMNIDDTKIDLIDEFARFGESTQNNTRFTNCKHCCCELTQTPEDEYICTNCWKI